MVLKNIPRKSRSSSRHVLISSFILVPFLFKNPDKPSIKCTRSKGKTFKREVWRTREKVTYLASLWTCERAPLQIGSYKGNDRRWEIYNSLRNVSTVHCRFMTSNSEIIEATWLDEIQGPKCKNQWSFKGKNGTNFQGLKWDQDPILGETRNCSFVTRAEINLQLLRRN